MPIQGGNRKRIKATFLVNKGAQTAKYFFRNSAIFDLGIIIYVFNDCDKFINYRPAPANNFIIAGNSEIPIFEYNNINIIFDSLYGTYIYRLKNAAYYKKFVCNLILLRLFYY